MQTAKITTEKSNSKRLVTHNN